MQIPGDMSPLTSNLSGGGLVSDVPCFVTQYIGVSLKGMFRLLVSFIHGPSVLGVQPSVKSLSLLEA